MTTAMSGRRTKGEDLRIDSAISALPESYQRWRASELGRITDELEQDLILELCGDVAGLRLLDVGCGDGVLAASLSRVGADVTGLDSDPRMLRAAQERQGSEVLSIRFMRGDVNALPFADRSFDVVTAIAVLCFVPDARSAMAEMARVLKPGGRLVVGELGHYSMWAASRRIKGWLGSAIWRAARFRSARDLRGLVEQAGLAMSAIRGAVFYPPVGGLAAMMASVDPALGRHTTIGAAFLTVAATRTDMTCINADAAGLANHSNNSSGSKDGRSGSAWSSSCDHPAGPARHAGYEQQANNKAAKGPRADRIARGGNMKGLRMLAAKASGPVTAAAAGSAFVLAPSWGWAQPSTDPSRYAYGPHMMGWDGGWYGMIVGPLIMILVLAVVIAVAVLLVRWLGGPWHGAQQVHHAPQERTPLDILKARYARGEIDKAEFEERRRVLSD